jgi:5-methylcytosine-specific restriction endonuclease McrA
MLDVRQHAVFVNRTQAVYHAHKQRARAAGLFLDYRLEDLRAFVLNNLGDRTCHYCRGPVTVDAFALNSRIPPERGGSYAFHNLSVTCADCDAAKGFLDYVEFKELMELLRTWAPGVRGRFLARLRGERLPRGRRLPPLPNPNAEYEMRNAERNGSP